MAALSVELMQPPLSFAALVALFHLGLCSRMLTFGGSLRDASSLAIGSSVIVSGACLVGLYRRLMSFPFHETEKVVVVTGAVLIFLIGILFNGSIL